MGAYCNTKDALGPFKLTRFLIYKHLVLLLPPISDHYDVFPNFDVKEWFGHTPFLKFCCNDYVESCTAEDLDLMECYGICVLDLRTGHYTITMVANKFILLRRNCKVYGCNYVVIFSVSVGL